MDAHGRHVSATPARGPGRTGGRPLRLGLGALALGVLALGAGAVGAILATGGFGADGRDLPASVGPVASPAARLAHDVRPRPVVPVAASSRVLFAGDVFWGRRLNTWSQASPLREAYPFSGLHGFDRGSYDAWVANLECPTVPGVVPTEHEEERLLRFNCPVDYLPELARWFSIVSLANNHTDNQEPGGLEATRRQLEAHGVQHFGHPDPGVLTDVCETVALPVTVRLSDGGSTGGRLPVAFCGYHGVFSIPTEQSLAVMAEHSRYMPVIAYPHMGVEYRPAADGLRTRLYRSMVDHGADAVLGNHPHWVQDSEAYRGRPIVYSMGNFIFDQRGDREVTRSAVLTLELALDPAPDRRLLAAWLSLGESCATFRDDCLTQARALGLERLPLTAVYDALAADSSDGVTRPAGPEVTRGVRDRLRWEDTRAGLEAGPLTPLAPPAP